MDINQLSIYHALAAIKANTVAIKMPSTASSFATMLQDLLAEKSLTATNLDGPISSFGVAVGPYTSYDEMFDAGFFGKDAVRIPDNREIKYCSLCGSEIEADGSCPICIVPLKLCGNTRAQNQAIENQHLQNHIQRQANAQVVSSTTAKAGGQSAATSKNRKK